MNEDLEAIGGALGEGASIAKQGWEMISGTTLGNELVAAPADAIRMRRAARQVRALTKMVKLIEDAGLAGHVVPDRTLFPLLEFVANESDEGMLHRWAGLLASAAAGEDDDPPKRFLDYLSILSPVQAGWLDEMQSMAQRTPLESGGRFRPVSLGTKNVDSLLHLERIGLTQQEKDVRFGGFIMTAPPRPNPRADDGHRTLPNGDRIVAGPFGLSMEGSAFLSSCQGPRPTA